MEKNKLTFKERLNAFRQYWRENWKKDCLYGFLCLALGFFISRCTPVEKNTVSADEISFDDNVGIILFELPNVSTTEGVYSFECSSTDLVCSPVFPSSVATLRISLVNGGNYTVTYSSSNDSFRIALAAGTPIRTAQKWDNYINGSPVFSAREFGITSQERTVTYSFSSDIPVVMYRVSYYPLSPNSNTASLFDLFNGATITYEIYEYDLDTQQGSVVKTFTCPMLVSPDMSSFNLLYLYNALPSDIRGYSFSVDYGHVERLIIKSRTGVPLDISKLNIVGFTTQFQGSAATIFFGDNLSLGDSFLLSYFGYFSSFDIRNDIDNLDYPYYTNYDLTLINITDNSGKLLSRLDSVVFSYGDTYENGYSIGYENGYNYAISVVDNNVDSAYNKGYEVAYNTVNTLSPNYVAGYNAGLSNANGSWVLSPINAINTIFNLELFVVGDFHFKLSYLVYLAIGGLLVGVLIRFLFHS